MRTIPLRGLNPYQPAWTIKCRVSSKGPAREWNKGPSNQGKLFSCDLVDAEGVEIRATFFKAAVDSFYDVIQEGGVYYFGHGKVKVRVLFLCIVYIIYLV